MEGTEMTPTSLKRIAIGAAAPIALVAASPLSAETAVPMSASFNPSAGTVADVAQSPQLTSINYVRLYRRLVQAGMVSQVLGYSLTVDADGKPVGCSFSRDFRMLATEREVCRSFIRSVTFEPARDAQGNPVAGTYGGEIEIASFFQPSR
ncbi:MAG: hypothetical protein EDM03_14730 [Porphyrobacter sp. IPPAS B-1204]|nr:MAG: hypothetical protein EDM03_14730 [Porphyrobacter sp. IPPAS B-1204]